MSNAVKPIPDGYHSIIPCLTIKNASEAIDFYVKAFNAVEIYRFAGKEGEIMHGEFKIGDSVLFISDEFPDWGALSPKTVGACPVLMRINVEDVDATFAQALAAGATELQPLANQFWGDRTGMLVDPYGYRWSLATHIEDVSSDEMERRAATFLAQC